MYKMKSFIDSHLHFLGMGYVAYLIELKHYHSIDEIIQAVKSMNHQSMIIGRGWNQEHFKEKRMLNKQDLNQISSELPVVMIRTCGHVLAVNDKMLELAKIDEHFSYQGTGSIDYQTGIISEDAINLIYESYPSPSKADLKKYLIKANEICLKNGITKVASDDFQIFPIPFEEIINVINECYEEDLIQVQITEQANLRTYDMLKTFIDKGYVNKNYGSYKMGPLKLLSDGSLGGRTARLKHPYNDDSTNRGILTYSFDELFKMVHLADQHHMDSVIHAIGDEAIDVAIQAIIDSLKITQRTNHNHAIIHAQLATHEQIKLMKEWNIGAIIQPVFLNSDIEIVASRIGQRKYESYMFHTMHQVGLNVGFSTDTPIESVNPLENIYAAVSRKSQSRPELNAFVLKEAFTIDEAIQCYINNNLKYVYDNAHDDEILISSDIHVNHVSELLKIDILETKIKGKTVYKKT